MFYLSMEMPLPKCAAHEGDAGEGISICVKVSTGCSAERRRVPAGLKCWEVHVYKLGDVEPGYNSNVLNNNIHIYF